jgi:uncharacterized protein (TIGR02246 family)
MPTTTQNQHADDVAAVVAEAERQQYDAGGFSALLTDDAAIVNFVGRRVVGRERIDRAMREALRSPLADVHTRYELVDVSFVTPDVALVNAIKHVSDRREGAEELGSNRGNTTFVLVRQGDGWRIALAQTTPIAV